MYKNVLLDFDFTLGDSGDAIVASASNAFRRLDVAIPDPERIRSMIGLSLPEIFHRATGIDDPVRAEEFRRLFVQHADAVMAEMTVLYPATAETIDLLKGAGLSLGVVSTKYRHRIEQILSRNGLLDRFDVIVGADEVASPKPDPAALILALERLGVGREETLYAGDHPVDALAAQGAAIDFVGVLSGPSVPPDFQGMPVRGFISGIAELPEWLAAAKSP